MHEQALHHVAEEFDDRNTIVYLTLGIVSVRRRWRQILRSTAPLPAPEDPADARSTLADARTELLILGVESVFRSLADHSQADIDRPRRRSREDQPPSVHGQRGLLR